MKHLKNRKNMKGIPPAARLAVITAVAAAAAAMLSAASGAHAACTEVSRICADSADRTVNGVTVSRECWRWEYAYDCTEDSPEKDRCSDAALPKACQAAAEACESADDEGKCLLVKRDLLCTEMPEGPGITPGEPQVTVSYSSRQTPGLPLGDGCKVTARTCLDDAPREIEVSNWPGEYASASPACWREALTVSCPSPDAAASCEKLEAAGCTPEGEKTCSAKDAAGTCIAWSASYVCPGPGPGTDGDGITGGETEIVPDGSFSDDDSACREALAERTEAGLACREAGRTCLESSEDGTCLRSEIRYDCAGSGENGCAALEKLAASGTCRMEGEAECIEERDGICLEQRASYLCGDLSADPPAGGELLGEVTETTQTAYDGCAALRENTACVMTAEACSEGPGIRLVDGEPVYRDCWAWQHEWTCRMEGGDECGTLASDPSCRLVSEACPEGEETCPRPTRVYRCVKEASTEAFGTICDGEACIAGVCAPADDSADEDFGRVIAELEVARQAGVYGDAAGNRFFSGQVLSCRDRKGAPSCCRSEPAPQTSNSAFGLWLSFGTGAAIETIRFLGSPYVYDVLSYSEKTSGLLNWLYGGASSGVYEPEFSFWGTTLSWTQSGGWQFDFSPSGFALAAAMHFYQGWASCRTEDQQLAMAKGERLCVYIGSVCSRSTPGLGCTEREERYVCFTSRLARILHEQGRPQLGRGWGTASFPDADGFTAEELAELDFSQIDLSEFVADIVGQSLKDAEAASGEALARAEERVREMLEGKLGTLSPVSGASGMTRTPLE